MHDISDIYKNCVNFLILTRTLNCRKALNVLNVSKNKPKIVLDIFILHSKLL